MQEVPIKIRAIDEACLSCPELKLDVDQNYLNVMNGEGCIFYTFKCIHLKRCEGLLKYRERLEKKINRKE